MPSLNGDFPLLFTSRELVAGNGYLAGVYACGRVLLVHEEDREWWMYGVKPGGIGEGGATPQEAHLQFITALRNILVDIAGRTSSFDEFEAAVRSFFHEEDREDGARWQTALDNLRAGAEVGDSFVASLKRTPVADVPCDVAVTRLDTPQTFSVQLNPTTDFTVPQLEAA